MDVLDTNLLIEGRRGLTTVLSVIEYPPALEGCRILFPKKEDYLKAIEIMVRLRRVGKPVPAVDAVIAAMCVRRNLRLLTRDGHFLRVKEVEPDLEVEVLARDGGG